MLEYSELKTMTGEIAYLRYKAYREPGNLKYIYEVIGLECALEICGYDVLTNVFEYDSFGETDVHICIRDIESFKLIDTFIYVFDSND